jgi:heme/copper-type cytochrome/quinol oxidase subunit 3
MKKFLLIVAIILAVIFICFKLYEYGKEDAQVIREQMETQDRK